MKKFISTLELRAGFRVKRTNGKIHTAVLVKALWEWWQKRRSAHKSAYRVDETKPDRVLLDQRTMKRKVTNQLTGLAWHRTMKADAYFPSILAAVVGDPNFMFTPQHRETAVLHWQAALGFKKGRKVAEQVVDVCWSRDDVKAKGR